MATIARSDLNSGILQEWLNRKVLKNLDRKINFYQFGEKPIVQDGYNTLRWAKFTRLTASNVSEISTEGTAPSSVDFDATSVTATPTQYGIQVDLSDLTVENTVIPFLKGAAERIGVAMAEKIDTAIQASLVSGATYVKYGPKGERTYPTDVTSSDTITGAALNYWFTYLKNKNVPTFEDGSYVAIMDPSTIYDLKNDSSTTTGWLEVSKYTPENAKNIFQGEIGKLFGIRIVENTNITTIASTVTLHPIFIFGKGAYGVSKWQDVTTSLLTQPDKSDPLNLHRIAAAKMAFGTTILEQESLVIVEVAATTIS